MGQSLCRVGKACRGAPTQSFWSPSKPANTALPGEGISLSTVKTTEPQPGEGLQPLFHLSCHHFSQALPHSHPHMVMAASSMVVRSLSGCLHGFVQRSVGQGLTGREPALLPPCFAAQGREEMLQGTSQGAGTSTGMRIPAQDALVPALPEVPKNILHHQLLSPLSTRS